MKNNKGFIFVETIIVLVVVMLSLTVAFMSYSLIVRRSKAKMYYNNSSDIYMLYSISGLGTDNENNYTKLSDSSGTFWVNKNNCSNAFFVDDCELLFDHFNLQNFGVIVDVEDALESNLFDNGTLSFLETLKKYEDDNVTNKKYIVARIYRNREYYFAALEIQKGDTNE